MFRSPILLITAIIILCSGVASGAPISGAQSGEALPLQLKVGASITDDVIRVGDLWENAGEKADLAVAKAPQPGHRVTLDVRWLSSLATRNGLDWRPLSAFDHIVIERTGQTLDTNLVETELREALALEGVAKSSTFEITNRQALSIMIPGEGKPTIAIKDLVVDSRTERFNAVVEAPAGSPTSVKIRINGRILTTTRLPVLLRAMNRGEVITALDLGWEVVRDESLHQDMVVDPKRIIGMEPRQLLKANAPIRTADIQRPMAVNRNSLVTMILQTPFMTLTAQGTAMDDGGVGDTVRVTNKLTKQVVEAKVQGQGTVIVAAMMNPQRSNRPLTAAAY
jgi:flagellar basal body P-ring formation protein FlgA